MPEKVDESLIGLLADLGMTPEAARRSFGEFMNSKSLRAEAAAEIRKRHARKGEGQQMKGQAPKTNPFL
jgi:hypothetical protein